MMNNEGPYRRWAVWIMMAMAMVLLSCERDAHRDYIQKKFLLPAFDTLRIEGPLNIYLEQDTANSMTVSGSAPVVEEVHYRVSNGILTLTSTYPYKMFRPSSNKAEIRLKVQSLQRIEVAEASGIYATGTLSADEMGLVVMSKYAEVDLDVNCRSFYYWDYSLSGGKVSLSGRTEVLKIWNYSLMTVDALQLQTSRVYCENNARSPCYIRPEEELHYSIRGQGDIFYQGDPVVIEAGEITSSGRLIRLE